MREEGSVAVLGAGAMGTALACHLQRNGAAVSLLATARDGAVLEAWRDRAPHPGLQLPFPDVPLYPPDSWAEVLPRAGVVFVAVTSAGLGTVLADAAPATCDGAVWTLATKGWEPGTLRTPSEVAASVLEGAPVVSLGGPALAAELAVGAPTGLLCATRDRGSGRRVANLLTSRTTEAFTTPDVAGAETAAAFKNVVAIAVGLAEGLAGRLVQGTPVNIFGNARAGVFAAGLRDMDRLVRSRGGRAATVLGLGGAGDLFLTCQYGRNGRFGRLLGAGSSVESALRAIGSTVEGVANTAAALALAERSGIDLPSARIVDRALRQDASDEGEVERLREIFVEALSDRDRPG
jgi:glycerol-3-phosphate dehydrogenase (NAD(P)+)